MARALLDSQVAESKHADRKDDIARAQVPSCCWPRSLALQVPRG